MKYYPTRLPPDCICGHGKAFHMTLKGMFVFWKKLNHCEICMCPKYESESKTITQDGKP